MAMNLKTRLDNIPTPEETFAEMFGGEPGKREQIVHLHISDLTSYPNKRWKQYSEEKLKQLASSIEVNGVLSPIIVRLMPPNRELGYDHYQILAGHNRTEACRMLHLDTIPCIIQNVDDHRANLIYNATNLEQRDNSLPSEKAFAYRDELEDLKHIAGERNDLVSNGDKVDTLGLIAHISDESRCTIARYVRLTYLVQELLDRVDNGKLPFRAGVALSYLSEDEQYAVDAYMEETRRKISLDQAEALKRYSAEMGPVDKKVLGKLFQDAKPIKLPSVKFTQQNLSQLWQYLPKGSQNQEAVDYILQALKYYQAQHLKHAAANLVEPIEMR